MFDTSPVFTDDEELIFNGISHVDAAYGGKDYTAFTCGRLDYADGKLYLYGRLWHGHVDKVIDVIIAEADRLMCWPMYLEKNADKGFLEKEIKQMDHWARGYPETENKLIKISTHLRKWWPHIVFVEVLSP